MKIDSLIHFRMCIHTAFSAVGFLWGRSLCKWGPLKDGGNGVNIPTSSDTDSSTGKTAQWWLIGQKAHTLSSEVMT